MSSSLDSVVGCTAWQGIPAEGADTQGPAATGGRCKGLLAGLRRARRAGHRPLSALHLR